MIRRAILAGIVAGILAFATVAALLFMALFMADALEEPCDCRPPMTYVRR